MAAGLKVTAEEFTGRVLTTAQSSVPVEVGDQADWDTGSGVPPGEPTEEQVRDVGHWEVVVSGTAPPVAVSTPGDDDWVYAWVSG